MGRVLIIGAGGVGTVVAHKVAQNADVFTDIMIASPRFPRGDVLVPAWEGGLRADEPEPRA